MPASTLGLNREGWPSLPLLPVLPKAVHDLVFTYSRATCIQLTREVRRLSNRRADIWVTNRSAL